MRQGEARQGGGTSDSSAAERACVSMEFSKPAHRRVPWQCCGLAWWPDQGAVLWCPLGLCLAAPPSRSWQCCVAATDKLKQQRLAAQTPIASESNVQVPYSSYYSVSQWGSGREARMPPPGYLRRASLRCNQPPWAVSEAAGMGARTPPDALCCAALWCSQLT